MGSVNWAIGASLSLLMRPLRHVHPLWPLSLLSILVGLAMLFVFRYTTDQRAMRQVKNRMVAHWLELSLFKDDLLTLLTAQKQIFLLNVVRLRYTLKPLLIVIGPVAFLLIHLDGWFGYRPLQPGETTIVTVRVDGRTGKSLDDIVLHADQGLAVETPPLRMPASRDVAWRIRAQEVGRHTVRVSVAGHTVPKTVEVSDSLVHVARRKVRATFWETLLNPGERPILNHAGVEFIQVQYPARSTAIFRWQMHWLAVFFILSTICGYACKGLMRVEL